MVSVIPLPFDAPVASALVDLAAARERADRHRRQAKRVEYAPTLAAQEAQAALMRRLADSPGFPENRLHRVLILPTLKAWAARKHSRAPIEIHLR